MIELIYVIIILFATISGAIAGLGGGVIIRPLFDLVGYHEVTSIAFYSSVAVFSMAIVSIGKQIKKGFKFDVKIVLLVSLGSVLGGILGQQLLTMITQGMDNDLVVVIQSTILLVLLIMILIYKFNKDKIKHYKIQNLLITFIVGLTLGTIAVFLGIGGGPINVVVFLVLFSYSTKQAAVYSIVTIFFAQTSNLATVFILGDASSFDLSFIPLIIITAIIGGIIGTKINLQLDDKKIDKYFMFLMFLLIGVSILNIATNV